MNNDKRKENDLVEKKLPTNEKIKPIGIILPIIVIASIIVVMFVFTYLQKKELVNNVEQVTNQMAEYVASNIANEIDYGASSINLAAVTIAQTMTSDTLDNPYEIILPMLESTPFGSIEYIRADGMNVMNIGEPFDASDRVYYIEGIKGNTGIWNNYHPKTSKETLMNFYTPLIYEGKIAGVITGYIAASSQVAPLFETSLYGKPIHGLLLDENNMVICSTIKSEFVKDFTLEMYMEQYNASEKQKQNMISILKKATNTAVSYKDPDGEGRICITTIPDTNWRVVFIVPATSFNEIISENTKFVVLTIAIISAILILYALFIILGILRRRRMVVKENARLEEENRHAFSEISEIRDIIASANMGTWRIELVDGKEPCMYVDDTMKKLLGIDGQERTPEKTYKDWFSNVKPEAVPSVMASVERMEQGWFDENTYLWIHPQKGVRYVRCGGTAQKIPGGYSLRGYHYDVDEVIRKEQTQMIELQEALNDKNEYYSTLGTLGDVFYSMHVIDLVDNSVVEFNSRDEVKRLVNQKHGATEMMIKVMNSVTVDDYKEAALEFTNLGTIADRMKNKKIMSKEFVGKHIGWFLASFITMETDEHKRPTKLIYTTRVIDEEKKQEEKLIQKTQTDEMTGLLNRRAYEEDIYEHNDTPDADQFSYISLDVNGLKVINDSKGHMAGDELIIGASYCMKKCLGDYGKLYRIGGDEFVAILYCSSEQMKGILAKFDDFIANWKGKLIDGVSISYGWINKDEEPNASVRQLGAIAEQRMYDAKSAYYRKSGVDRRGQQDAHKALCESFTKILKINITENDYQIVNMDVSEQTDEKGFSSKISEWLSAFGKSGQVHPEDLDNYLKFTNIEYMKKYFNEGKNSLHIFYRRKYESGFKQVMMELIPANDYSEDNQSLFLYVKDIDKV